jgi:hypothetical protein
LLWSHQRKHLAARCMIHIGQRFQHHRTCLKPREDSSHRR